MKKLKPFIPFLVMAAVFGMSYFGFIDPAEAAWKKAGITPDGKVSNNGIYKDLENIVYLTMAVGGFWVILCLLFAGMKLSAAQGNPQNRTQGFIGLAMASIGLFVIVKAYDIAGWIAGFGS
ncbi:hypothetical protein [Neobacillus sp.]|uniref:hypothetical protein n=1 Tax=Neobacillus sp. TaxID=2675273 RepID=UPI0035B5497F